MIKDMDGENSIILTKEKFCVLTCDVAFLLPKMGWIFEFACDSKEFWSTGLKVWITEMHNPKYKIFKGMEYN